MINLKKRLFGFIYTKSLFVGRFDKVQAVTLAATEQFSLENASNKVKNGT